MPLKSYLLGDYKRKEPVNYSGGPGGMVRRAQESQKKAAEEAARQERLAEREQHWQETYQPIAEELTSTQALREKKLLEQAMADARMRLGYAKSAGYGAGAWGGAQTAIERAALSSAYDISGRQAERLAQMKYGYQQLEDAKAYQSWLSEQQHLWRMEEIRYQAEMNDPSWWEQLGSIVGQGMGIFFPGGGGAGSSPPTSDFMYVPPVI